MPVGWSTFSLISSAGKADFRGKVTGANQGIGLGIADCCLSNGASKVYSIDIGEVGEDFQTIERSYPGRIIAITADVTSEESIQNAIDKIVEKEGAIHGMVCNAGRTKHKPALDFTTEEIKQLWNVNVQLYRIPPSKRNTNCLQALRLVLYRTRSGTCFYQAEHSWIHRLHRLNGIV